MAALAELRARIHARVKPALPGIRDAHVYGGGLLLASGAWMVYAPAGLIVFGALLLYLGLRVPPRAKMPKPERGGA